MNQILTCITLYFFLLLPVLGFAQPQFMEIDRDSVHFSAANTTTVVQLKSNRSWSLARSNNFWLFVSQEQGTGNCALSITVTSNNNTGERRGQLTIVAGEVVRILNIKQDGAVLEVDKDNIILGPVQGTQLVQLHSNREWEVSTSSSWLSVSPMSGTGDTLLTINATENNGVTRTGEISITAGSQNKTLHITQEADMLELGMDTIRLNRSQATRFVQLQSNRDWSVNNSSSWISVSPMNGTGNAQLAVEVAANSGATRAGDIIITAGLKNRALHIIQDITNGINDIPMNEVISIFPNPTNGSFSVNFGKHNGSKTITIFDMTGKVVKTFSTSSQTADINIEPFMRGIYVLKTQTAQGLITQKVVLE